MGHQAGAVLVAALAMLAGCTPSESPRSEAPGAAATATANGPAAGPPREEPPAAAATATANGPAAGPPREEPPAAAAIDARSPAAQQATALFRQGRTAEAIPHLAAALRSGPDDARLRQQLAVALVEQGRFAEALAHFEHALRQAPSDPTLHANLGLACAQHGELPRAVAHLRQALQLRPAMPHVANDLAWILATADDPALRDGPEAVRWAEHACRLHAGPHPQLLSTLAAAYAECGRFEEAVEACQRALDAAGQSGSDVARIHTRLEHYRARRAWRQAFDSAEVPPPSVAADTVRDMYFRKLGTLGEDGLAAACDLAWIFATHDDPQVRDPAWSKWAMETISLGSDTRHWRCLDVLAAACAALGQWQAAVEHLDRALDLVAASAATEHAAALRQRRDAFQRGVAYLESFSAPLKPSGQPALEARQALAAVFEVHARRMQQAGRGLVYLEALRCAVQMNPQDDRLRGEWAQALLSAGQWSAAADAWQTLLARDSGHAEAHHGLAVCLVELGRLDEALAHFERALRHQADSAALWKNYGLALLAAGQTEPAVRALRETLRRRSDEPSACNNLAWLLCTAEDAKLRNGPEAVHWAQTACRATGYQNVDCLSTLAAAHAESGNYEQAVQVAETALEMALRQGRNAQAQELLHRKMLYAAQQPIRNLDRMYRRWGFAAFAQGNDDDAVWHLFAALRSQPEDVRARNLLAVALTRQGKLELALRHFDAALRVDPTDSEVLCNRSMALAALGRLEEALDDARRAYERQPHLPQLANNLAWLLLTVGGDAHQAMRLAQQACAATKSRDPHCLATLAEAHRATGDPRQAVTIMRRAIELAEAAGQTGLAGRFRDRLNGYTQAAAGAPEALFTASGAEAFTAP